MLAPTAKTTVDRDNVGVAHFLEIIGHERGTESAAAIAENARLGIRDTLLDIALDNALAEMNRAGSVAGMPFAFLANVDQIDAGLLGFDIRVMNGNFFDAIFCIIDQFKELRAVQHGTNSLAQIHPGSSTDVKRDAKGGFRARLNRCHF